LATASATAHADKVLLDRPRRAARERDRLTTAVAHATVAELDAREVAVASRERWLDARVRRLEAIAGELAAQLVDGEPCAVCGLWHTRCRPRRRNGRTTTTRPPQRPRLEQRTSVICGLRGDIPVARASR
jgi:hypothetical protein